MEKSKFVYEFEINASKKMLYPYISQASGLAQWFADDVTINEDKVFNFVWEGQDHKATMVGHRTNSFVRFQYHNGEEEEDPNWVEFKIDTNELTQTTYIKAIEYSDFDDQEEQAEVWEHLFSTLKELVGG